jgi:hypothetical protein
MDVEFPKKVEGRSHGWTQDTMSLFVLDAVQVYCPETQKHTTTDILRRRIPNQHNNNEQERI